MQAIYIINIYMCNAYIIITLNIIIPIKKILSRQYKIMFSYQYIYNILLMLRIYLIVL